jgi:lipoyl(octanoyl) transferase
MSGSLAQTPFRLLPLAEAAPARNMAIDAALLEAGERPTLRLYRWRPPAVSLGHFQRDVDLAPYRAAGLPIVRRMTGGGAIVHADEVTYSLLLPDDQPLLQGRDVKESYAVLHAPIRDALRRLGVPTEVRAEPVPSHADRGFLCFARATELDLVAAGRKIVGSAQRRTPGRILQHGSILLRNHPLQPGTSCVEELAGRATTPEELAASLVEAFASVFGPLAPGALTPAEEAVASRLEPTFVV